MDPPSVTINESASSEVQMAWTFPLVDNHFLSMDEPPAASAESMHSFKWKLAFMCNCSAYPAKYYRVEILP